jgi:hypothetical protein
MFKIKTPPPAASKVFFAVEFEPAKPVENLENDLFRTARTPFLNPYARREEKDSTERAVQYKEFPDPVLGVLSPTVADSAPDLKTGVLSVLNPFPDGWTNEIQLAPGFQSFDAQCEYAQSLLPEPTRWTN